MTKNDILIKEKLAFEYKVPNNFLDGKYTKTSLFVLPMIGINMYHHTVSKFFRNAFLQDISFPEYENESVIFVLFETKSLKDPDWKKLYKIILSNQQFVTDYVCGIQEDKTQLMVIFEIPEKYHKDLFQFKKGRYSKFSDSCKKLFPEVVPDVINNKFSPSIAYSVLNKTEHIYKILHELIEEPIEELKILEEIYEKPNRERETFKSTSLW